MTNFQRLNMASELRRAANWLGRNQIEKLPQIKRILEEAEKENDTKKVLKHFKISKYSKNSRLLGEMLLTSSIRLQNGI